jgi:type IV pilus assembly protein PilV
MHRSTQQQRGLTLTETATALVLLAIGVLCIATLYLERSQAAPAVLLHSKASRLAQEMMERIRARQTAQVHFENPVGVICNPRLVDASPQAAATNDIACWQSKVAETLPNGSGAIAHDGQSRPPAYLITVSWSPPDRGTASYLLRVEIPNSQTLAVPQAAVPATRNPTTSLSATSTPPAPADAARAAN